jgi:hypothetical protein
MASIFTVSYIYSLYYCIYGVKIMYVGFEMVALLVGDAGLTEI